MVERDLAQAVQDIIDQAKLLQEGSIKRSQTIHLKDLLSDKGVTSYPGAARVISQELRVILEVLQNQQDVYSEYARIDILDGLSVVDTPSTQGVIAESLLDPSELVVKRTEKILLSPGAYIYPEILKFLLIGQDDKSREVAISILENNPRGGLTPEGKVATSVVSLLEEMMADVKDKERGTKAAILTSILNQRLDGSIPDTLKERAQQHLAIRVQEGVIKPLTTLEVFSKLVEDIVFSNSMRAKLSSNLEKLNLNLPSQYESEPPELSALVRILRQDQGHEDWQLVNGYIELLALVKETARGKLAEVVKAAREQEEEQRKRFEAESDAKREELRLEAERQAQIEAEARVIVLENARRARQKYPHLST